MRARDVTSVIEEFAPAIHQEGWDNSGYCIGSPDQSVNGALLALDCTDEVVTEAIESGINMIITHHPLIFDGVKKISQESITGNIIIKAIKNDIVIYSAHTNLDKVFEGVSWRMAEKIGLVNMRVLDPDSDGSVRDHEVGLGVIGELKESQRAVDFVERIKDLYGLSCVRTSPLKREFVSRIAMCGGSGKSLINKAKAEKADVYISGDIPYHEFFCEENFIVMDIGHYESEIDIVDSLYSLVTKKIPNFAVRIAKMSYNPIHYY